MDFAMFDFFGFIFILSLFFELSSLLNWKLNPSALDKKEYSGSESMFSVLTTFSSHFPMKFRKYHSSNKVTTSYNTPRPQMWKESLQSGLLCDPKVVKAKNNNNIILELFESPLLKKMIFFWFFLQETYDLVVPVIVYFQEVGTLRLEAWDARFFHRFFSLGKALRWTFYGRNGR